MRFIVIAAWAALMPQVVIAGEPVRLQPSSRWVVDYAENSCRLIRKFGTGDSETLLAFESESPDDMDMMLVGKPLESGLLLIDARFLPVQDHADVGMPVKADQSGKPGVLFSHVQFLPDGIKAKLAARRQKLGDRPKALDLAEEQSQRAERLVYASKITELEIEARHGRPVVLETGSMGQPITAFDACSRESLRDWGVDPALEDKIVRPVWLKNRNELINSGDYPRGLLNEGEQSEVKARVLVDASGRVTKCTPLSYFKLPEFNKLVCDRVTQSGKFEPAELADGTKVPSYYTLRFLFRIAY